ncbi:hydantoinase B/oxoprolinase family protein [Sulfitobacter sp. BDSS02]|nr:hydantoinase B/oxoprolinase family protein [Sulfitobacter sp. BDSS02]MBR9848007.1 hydantoinase B/oxoprolinase family protein [Paracoccaceae bacterium]
MSDMDPITLAVLKGRLEQIADEMDATLFRSAFNPIIAEAHDASHGLYHAETGETLIQGKSGLPIFVGAMAYATKAVIDKAREDGNLSDGDVYIFNDPYDGGTHLSDFKLIRPYFRDGELFCWIASVGHWHDVGGNVPGNYNPVATESFQEGMLIPPVKLYSGGKLNPDIVTILSANSRLPRSVYGDMNGQVNALQLGIRRLDALLDEYSGATVQQALTTLRDRGAVLMRARIAGLPDGTWSATDYLDNDGITDEQMQITLKVTVRGEELTLDFTGTSAQCMGPLNISRSTAEAACYVALKHVFPDVPANGGVLEPVQIDLPEESLLFAKAPRPVGGYTETILRLIDVVFQCFAQAAPEIAPAPAYGTINALSISGHNPGGQRWVMFSFFGGGHGGHSDGDGLNHGNAPISTATIPPLEILESAYPVKFTQWALRPNSGGEGEYRGGLGAIYEIELLADDAQAFLFGERGRTPPPGVNGGGPALRNRFTFPDGQGGWAEPPMTSKMTGLKLTKGQRVRLETPGGGGWGDPAKRAPALTEQDQRLGYVETKDKA